MIEETYSEFQTGGFLGTSHRRPQSARFSQEEREFIPPLAHVTDGFA
jgi:hypothetical protein